MESTTTSEVALRVYPPIYKLGWVGKWIRETLMKLILQGTPVILKIEEYRLPYLTVFMKGVAFMGEEDFYTLLLPFILWICDFRLGCLLSILMAMGFYLTGVFKNSLCLPRPPRPPVSPADRTKDWSMPSHHSILNINVPWYIWLYIYINFDWSYSWLLAAFVAVCFWCFSILFSRLYLGVHSPADIVVGGCIGCVLLLSWLQLDTLVDSVLAERQFTFMAVILSLVLLSLHPDPHPKTIIISETITMMFVTVGVLIGAHLSKVFAVDTTALFEKPSQSLLVYYSLCRYVLGMAVLLSLKFVLAKILRLLIQGLLSLLGVQCNYVKRVSQVGFEVVHYNPQTFIVLDKVSGF